MEYEPVIGLEVHLHLKTKTKAFCGCSTEFGNTPNTQVCPVCLGFPGSLPVFNKTALDYAIKVALALHCQVEEYTRFDRKNYFYPDLPKNYQISQYDLPLSKNGYVDISVENNPKRIGIIRVHIEEDAGKLIHEKDLSLVDFNRSGIPLLEIVSYPDINSAQEAYDYLTLLKSILEYLEVSDCDMEKGSLRCYVNISLRPQGAKELGIKTELKNMNSFKAVKDALVYEVERQSALLKEGQALVQETRLWDEKGQQTISMRTKEGAQDYRYFPDPDLPPFIISQEKIEEIQRALPELPQEKAQRFMKTYGLTQYDAKILVSSKNNADYAEDCLRGFSDKDKKSVANWLIGPLAAITSASNLNISELQVPAKNFIELVELVEKKQVISSLTGKSVLQEMAKTKKTASQIIEEKNLAQISDPQSLEKEIRDVIKENAKSVDDFKAGKANALMFLGGQAMRKTKG